MLRKPTEEHNISDHEIASLYLHDSNLSVRELCRKTGKSIAEIYRIVKRSGHSPNRLSTNHGNVHMFADSGLPLPHIADLTGYTTRNVRYILDKRKNDIRQ